MTKESMSDGSLLVLNVVCFVASLLRNWGRSLWAKYSTDLTKRMFLSPEGVYSSQLSSL